MNVIMAGNGFRVRCIEHIEKRKDCIGKAGSRAAGEEFHHVSNGRDTEMAPDKPLRVLKGG